MADYAVGRRTRCAGMAVITDSSPEPAAAGTEGTRRVGRGWQAHSVRRESCDGSQQSRACGALVRRGACWEDGQAHSVRRESCDGSQQSRACGALVRRGA